MELRVVRILSTKYLGVYDWGWLKSMGVVSEAAANLKPHSSQKTAALGERLPHWGHCNSSFVPHLRQNLAPWRFLNWHFWHSMVPSNQSQFG
jgi:hypothetical protein